MAKMKKFQNKTVAFANQKGGVGKTVLCTLFANYLYENGIPSCVIDADLQSSISYMRKENLDKEKLSESEVPWTVSAFDLKCPRTVNLNDFIQSVNKLMTTVTQLDGCVIFDTPGNLSEDGLAPVFSKVDYIVCPYFYDQNTLSSTGVFIQTLDVLRQVDPNMKAKMLFLPNAVQKGVGLKNELEMWRRIDSVFDKYGTVCPKIERKVCLQRYSTLDITTEQKNAVKESFDFIIRKIYPKFKFESE